MCEAYLGVFMHKLPPLVNLVIVKTKAVDTDSWGQFYREKRDIESAYIMCTGMIVLLESRKCSSLLAMEPRRVS